MSCSYTASPPKRHNGVQRDCFALLFTNFNYSAVHSTPWSSCLCLYLCNLHFAYFIVIFPILHISLFSTSFYVSSFVSLFSSLASLFLTTSSHFSLYLIRYCPILGQMSWFYWRFLNPISGCILVNFFSTHLTLQFLHIAGCDSLYPLPAYRTYPLISVSPHVGWWPFAIKGFWALQDI
jgi:hypothetical protein